MIRVPCKITLTGDEDYARDFIGAAQSQLRILEDEMKFQDLKQGTRKTELSPRVSVEAIINHQFREVKIHCTSMPTYEEKGEEKLPEMGRFFARVRRGGLYEEPDFYWLTFKDGGVVARKVNTDDPAEHGFRVVPTLWRVTNLPIHMKHSATKAFMLNAGDEEFPNNERWVSSQHTLVKGCVIYFLPLIYPNILNPMYPMPPLCAGGPLEIGDLHRCPPNRFYVNTAAGTLAWYHAADNFIFGMLLRIKEGMLCSVDTFCYYSSDADGHGFDPYWFYQGSAVEPLSTHPEVPIYMMTDIGYFNEKTLEVILPWNFRPIKITRDFTTGNEVFEQVTSCSHWYWTEEGFEQRPFAEIFQEDKSGIDEYKENIVSNPLVGCGGHATQETCLADDRHASEYQAYKKQWIDRGTTVRESNLVLTIFEREVKTASWNKHIIVDDHKHELLSVCYWRSVPGECYGGAWTPWTIKRYVEETIKQKTVDSVVAEWGSPNMACMYTDITRCYTKANALQGTRALSNIWGGSNYSDFVDLCAWPFLVGGSHEWEIQYFVGGKCFYPGFPMPGEIWSEIESEGIRDTLNGPEWWRNTHKNDYAETSTDVYNVDGDISFDMTEVDRTYYLDDRSTEDSEGLLVAGRAADVDYDPQGFPIFTSTYWEIYHDGVDVTTDLLSAIHCEVGELIEIGLV